MSLDPQSSHRAYGTVDLSARDRHPELMDQPGLTEIEHFQALNTIGRFNRLTGLSRIFWRPIARLAGRVPDRPLRILDLACGGGDLACSLWQHAQRAGIEVEVAECGISPVALKLCRMNAERLSAPIEFFELDAVNGTLPDDYNVLTCSLFLHHLSDADGESLLRRMAESARRMVLLDDQMRSRLGFWLVILVTKLLTRSRLCRVDGPPSIRAAFAFPEVQQLVSQAGLSDAILTKHWPDRFLLEWRRT